MIDIHCHLLPGIDDGPASIEESLELCRIAVADGVTHAVVTPHIHPGRWENTPSIIAPKVHDLSLLLKKHAIPLQIKFAGEVRLTDFIIQQLDMGEIPFYEEVDGYKLMLLEFPHGHIIPGSEKLVEWLLRRQIRPLLAHPERNKQLLKNPALLLPFLELGCWVQVTGGSLLGNFGSKAQQLAHRLLCDDQVAVVASDGHNTKARKPVLSEAFNYIAENFDMGRAQRLTQTTPGLIGGFIDSAGSSMA